MALTTSSTVAPSPSEIISAAKWQSTIDYINRWHYRPDIQSLDIILSAITGQFDPNSQPIWLFLIGPSGSGKTSLGLTPLINLPNVHEVSTLTPHTWFSGYIGSKNAGLAARVGSGIVTFPDFTCILSLRDESRHEIAGHMRLVFDGHASPENGAVTAEPWTGKITVIAAVTPAIEKYWSFTRDMGDRFINVRWDRLHGPSVAKASRGQQGNELVIRSTMQANMVDFFTSPRINYSHIPEPSESQGNQLDNMAEITCILRTQVTREANGNREIRDIPQSEGTGRVGRSLPAMVRYHAILHRRDYINDSDINVARRLSIDSIPYTRSKIISAIPPDEGIAADSLLELIQINPSTLKWNIEELMALGVVREVTNLVGKCYEMTNSFKEMWKVAFPL
jgi:hypothetical protein